MKNLMSLRASAESEERSTVRLPAGERKAKIETAARAELTEQGYQNFSPADVARRCHVSEATIYRYYPTKRDLVTRVAEDWFEELLTVEPDLARQLDVENQLRHLIHLSLWVIRSQPALSRFVLQELRPDPNYRSMRIFELNRRFTSRVVDVVNDAIATGQFRPDVAPALVRNMIYGCIEHQTWSFLRGEGDFDIDAVARGIASVICHGMEAVPTDATKVAPLISQLESAAGSICQKVNELRAILSVA